MSWNYRVLAHQTVSGVYFQVHEVYYDGNGVPNGYAEPGATISAEKIKGLAWTSNELKALRWTANKMKLALKRPILKAWDFPNEYTP